MGFQEAAVSAAPTASDYVQEHKVARRQELPEQPEHLGEKLLTRPHNTTPDPEHQGTPKPLSFIQESCSSQSDQQPLNIHNHICASVSLSAYQGTYHRQPPGQSPTVVMQMPSSGASTCQHQEAMEDRVLVFDMATGNTRVGLLCHEPMDSQAMLVGMVPKHPCICIPKSMQPMGSPIQLPDSPPSNFWSTSPMLSSPVPSSLSPGSYREVSLLPKEAKFNLETQNTSGPETPIRLPVHTGPVSLGMPLQFGEKILTPVSNTGWSKPDAEKNEPRHILWPLDTSKMPDGPMVQSKKLQWVTSEKTPEPDLSAKPQEVTKVLVQEHTKNQNQEKVISVHAEDPAKVLLTGQPLLAEQLLLARKIPPDCQHSQADQPPSIEKSIHTELTRLTSPRQPPLPDQPLLTGKLFLTKHVTFTEQFPFSKEPICAKEPVPLKGLPTTREPGQAATLCQEGESLGLPTHVAVLQMPLDSEKTCVFVKREKVSCGTMQSSSTHQMAWQQDSSSRAQEEQLSLMTFAMPDTGCKVLPISVVGTEPQGAQFKMKAGDVTHSSVVTRLGLLQGNCNELLSSMDALPVKSAGICCRLQGPCQNMAAIVIDTGTGFTKCGLAGEDHVLSVVPSRVQLLQHSAQGQPRYTIPENQEGACPVLTRGVVSDWDALEVLWQHLFYCRLGVQPEELAVLVADSPVSPRTNREKVAELLFEHFHVPAMQTVHQALLTLYSYGRTTGLVLGSGYGTSYVTPILTGDLAPLETHRLDVAGCDLTEYLAQLLLAGGHSQLKTEVVNKIKEACCYVISDMSCNQAQAPVNFVLPDKQVITLGSECFCCPEALFQPSLLGLNQPGLSQLALQSISCLEAKQQEQLLANVVLDGGSTLLNGFPERLRQELGPCATVLGSPHRAVTAWLGGSIMASRDSFQSLWLSRCQYEEEGSRAIYKYHL
ncbi:PREDICTED: uncharacterized protein LOC102858109 [Elephantulus edwardii]|uniref:uncharacterized protein LOC102858109 n=1 Tax=Elephantulus edwardii TaxID=28737 RepID=UPI0003F07112|nr:PREDICTED: uncharacterized protein LOC102858109 [Elephantulus edwardii]